MPANPVAVYPQSSGAGSGGMTLISTYTADGSVGTHTFASIPQTFTHLRLIYQANSSAGSADYVDINFNGDGAANYLVFGPGFGPLAASTPTVGVMNWGTITSGNWAIGVVDIAFYRGAQNKIAQGISNAVNLAGNSSLGFIASILWENTAAITSLAIKSQDAALFLTGSQFSLYGY